MTISHPAPSSDQLDENSVAASRQSRLALDALTFFLADVQDGLRPYLAIYLTSVRRWAPSDVGIAMASVVIGTLLAQLPAGAFIDVTRRKRFAVSVAAGVVATCCIVMISYPQLPVIVIAQTLIGAAAAILPPAVAGISLGLVGRWRFARRTGRNEAFNHAGNVAASILAGALGTYLGYAAIFYLVAGMAIASGISAMLIRESEIDHEIKVAREYGIGEVTHEIERLLLRPGRGERSARTFDSCMAFTHRRAPAWARIIAYSRSRASTSERKRVRARISFHLRA